MLINKTPLLLFLLIVANCSTNNGINIRGIETYQQTVVSMQKWQADGKIAIITDDSVITLNFIWKNNANDCEIKLWSILSGDTALVLKTGQNIDFSSSRGDKISGNQYEIFQKTGFNLPITAMQYWLKGIRYPQEKLQAAKYSDLGYLQQFRQNDWQVSFSKHQLINNVILPSRINLIGQNAKIKIAISNWKA